MKIIIVITVIFLLPNYTRADETVDCNKVSEIIRQYGANGKLTREQARRYFSEKTKSISTAALQAELRKGPITAETLERLKMEAADRSATGLIQQYGNGDNVTEEDLQNYLVQTDPNFKKSCNPDLLTRVFQDKLHIRNSTLEVKGEQLPAQFSWTRAKDSGHSFQIDAAVSYDFPQYNLDSHWTFSTKPAVEVHTSTLETASRDSITAKLPTEIVYGLGETSYTQPDNLLKSFLLTAGPTFETDRKADTTNYGAEIFFAPAIPTLAIGAPWHFGVVYPSWQPYIGFEGGYVTQAKEGVETDTDFERFVLKLHGQVFITNYFEIAADYTHRTFLGTGPLSGSDRRSFQYLELSAILWLDPTDQHLSIGLTYKDGRSTPKFVSVNSTTAFIGIKF